MAVVLITGCSSGFGLAFAQAFAARGDQVVATMRRPRDIAGVAVQQMDVTSSDSIAHVVQETLSAHGRIDVLVNNAGIGAVGALETISDQTLRDVFDTNVFGAVAVTRAVLPRMRQQQSGRVVFVSAIGALLNTAYLGAYCASKHAIDCIAATFDIELRPFGIRSSSVLPSAFNTGMGANLRLELGDGGDYEGPATRYYGALRGRIENGPTDLSPVVRAVIDAATSPEPKQRYLVAPHLADVLGPVVGELERLHQRELELTPSGGGNAPTR
jgi:NAD(P)-dependent dehydrogenase (short-subunit alcohol dehydrogenase family)